MGRWQHRGDAQALKQQIGVQSLQTERTINHAKQSCDIFFFWGPRSAQSHGTTSAQGSDASDGTRPPTVHL
eukprot:8788338-Lingulodinium_polyedra.AAC.1